MRAYAVSLRGPLGEQAAARLPHRVGRRGAARADGRRPRYLVVDYKTNWLGPFDEPLTAAGLPARGAWTPRWGTPTTRSRRCCTPWCCTGSCAGGSPATTPSGTSAACSTSTSAACAGRTPRSSTAIPCGVFTWRAPVAARRGALRPAGRTGGDAMTELFEPTSEHDWRLARGRTGLLAAFNDGRRAHLRRPPRRRPRRRARPARTTSGCCSPLALAVRAVRRGSVCLVLDDGHGRGPRPALARRGGLGGRRTSLDPRRARACCGWDHRPAVPRPLPPARDAGLRRPRWPAPRSRRRSSTRPRLAAAAGAGTRRARERPAGRGRRDAPCAGGRRSSPAAPAPARRPRSRGCWRCWPTRPPRAASGSRSR